MRLTKKQRDEAVMVLRAGADAILADLPWTMRTLTKPGHHAGLEAIDAVGFELPWQVLGDAGWPVSNLVHGWRQFARVSTSAAKRSAVVGLELAALLEDGWSPGDPVYRIGDES